MREGVEQFGALVQKVDFPKFVGGLIKNVFQAIVESSIEQMRAYGELIANVAKTVDQFMPDNIAAGQRPRLAGAELSRTRSSVEVAAGRAALRRRRRSRAAADRDAGDAKGENPDAAPRRDQPGARASTRRSPTSPTPNAELRLVTAARLQMAKSRQQLLSSMVMLGINRIVVTDGSINAKVVFDMRASDKAQARRHGLDVRQPGATASAGDS